MKWSWKLGRFAGIDVYVHATFLLLIGWIGVSHWLAHRDVGEALTGMAFILALFACVVLHEYGHALTARRYGIKTRDITLLPIGGLARLERMPDKPQQELRVALAGPAVNVVIAALIYVVLWLLNALEPMESLGVAQGGFFTRLMVVNIFLVLFNMLPAFPMDGGRVLRALLAARMDYVRATQIAATLGQGMALLFGFAGFFYNPFLLFIALFVWIGAAQEASMVEMRIALAGIPVERAMITDFQTVSSKDSLERVVELILAGSQQDFPVVDEGRVSGVLTKKDLLLALAQQGQNAPASQVMRQKFEVADAAEMLDGALARLQSCDCHTMPVVRGGRLVGVLTLDNVGEFLMIQSALGARPKARLAPAA